MKWWIVLLNVLVGLGGALTTFVASIFYLGSDDDLADTWSELGWLFPLARLAFALVPVVATLAIALLVNLACGTFETRHPFARNSPVTIMLLVCTLIAILGTALFFT